MARLVELNDYLPSFPLEVQGSPAPIKMADDELKDIGEYAYPQTWQKGMVQLGFHPAIHTLTEFIKFCEWYEYTESNDQMVH